MHLRHDRVLWRQLDDRILVLDVHRSRYLRLNESGSVLWQALDTPRRPDELVDVLTDAFDIDEQQAGADVAAFLRQLHRLELLREAA